MAWWGHWKVDLCWQGKHGDLEGRCSEEVLVPEGLEAEDELIKETRQREASRILWDLSPRGTKCESW